MEGKVEFTTPYVYKKFPPLPAIGGECKRHCWIYLFNIYLFYVCKLKPLPGFAAGREGKGGGREGKGRGGNGGEGNGVE